MTDLTKITTPFGLLDAKTRAALINHGGPYEFWLDGEWDGTDVCDDEPSVVHRVKPATPKPREWWIVMVGGLSIANCDTPEEADKRVGNYVDGRVVHVIEVMP